MCRRGVLSLYTCQTGMRCVYGERILYFERIPSNVIEGNQTSCVECFTLFYYSGMGKFSFGTFCLILQWPALVLTIEFNMLLIAPFFFVVIRKRLVLHLLFVVLLGVSAFLYAQVPYMADRGAGLYYSTIARSWQFVAGMVAADVYLLLLQRGILLKHRCLVSIVTAASFICFLAATITLMYFKQCEDLHYWNFTFDFNLLSVSLYMLLIPLLFHMGNIGGQSIRNMLCCLSVLTYPVYLFHVLVVSVVGPAVTYVFDNSYGNVLLGGLLSGMVTIVISYVAMRWQKKIERHCSILYSERKEAS